MQNKNLIEMAENFIACFCGDKPLEDMNALLCDDLIFRGPFVQFNSAEDYFNSVLRDPPVNVKIKILSAYESKNSVCLIYRFTKPGVETVMAQTFEFKNGKISMMRLIFDTAVFQE